MKKIFALLLFATALTGMLRAQSETIDLRSHGTLTLFLPDNWKVSTGEFGERVIVTIEPKDDANASCTLTVTFPERDEFATKAKLKMRVEINARQFEEVSVEGKAVARELSTRAGMGYMCNFTDSELVGKPSEKGNFKVISVGMIRVASDLLIETAISADGFRTAAYQDLLGALEGMEHKPAGRAKP